MSSMDKWRVITCCAVLAALSALTGVIVLQNSVVSLQKSVSVLEDLAMSQEQQIQCLQGTTVAKIGE
jgi:hypothetical protein